MCIEGKIPQQERLSSISWFTPYQKKGKKKREKREKPGVRLWGSAAQGDVKETGGHKKKKLHKYSALQCGTQGNSYKNYFLLKKTSKGKEPSKLRVKLQDKKSYCWMGAAACLFGCCWVFSYR